MQDSANLTKGKTPDRGLVCFPLPGVTAGTESVRAGTDLVLSSILDSVQNTKPLE